MKRAHRSGVLALALAVAACGARGGMGAAGAAGNAGAPSDGRDAAAEAVGMASREHAAGHAHGEMHGEANAHGAAGALPASPGPGYTVADVHFMQHMIGHHAQAVVMAGMAPSHGAGKDVAVLAEKIDISQRDEIGFMERWLAERGQAVPDEAQRRAMRMPGLLTPEEMARLDAARGAEFDWLFLTFMIHHHRGALEMVETLFADPAAAQDPEIFRFVTDVDTDQRAEIYVMQSMLDMLATPGGSGNR